MKKSLIIALGAIALVACTKTSVSYEQTGEIGFAPVVRKNSTKAAVQGVIFEPSWSIKVFGYYDNSVGKGNGYTDGKFTESYLDGVEFTKKTDGSTWTGKDHSYYWPKTGSLLFAGYAPAGFAGVTHDLATNKFSVAEFEQPAFSATTDLLYAGYDVSILGETVPMKFAHALSWITVQAKADATIKVKITGIEIQGVAEKGSSTALPAWTTSETKKTLSVYAPSEADIKVLASTDTKVESNQDCCLVFPQTLTDAAIIKVSYEMDRGDGTFVKQSPFTKKLNELKSGTNPVGEWVAGSHYIYNIIFGAAAEIEIEPSVSEWTRVPVENISAAN